jgi:hypothetical protein
LCSTLSQTQMATSRRLTAHAAATSLAASDDEVRIPRVPPRSALVPFDSDD